MEDILIRKEQSSDFPQISEVIEKAFKNDQHSDHQEQFLVERLRASEDFIPDLALVAEHNGKVIGYILFTKIEIIDDQKSNISLSLAPVAVSPEFQKKGIGKLLIEKGHEIAKELGFTSVIILGHPTYYPKFGYKEAAEFGINLPFDVPKEYCMAIELEEDALQNITGLVKYPPAFY